MTLRNYCAVLLATLLIFLVLVLPDNPRAFKPTTLLLFPLELPAILAVFVVCSWRFISTRFLCAFGAVLLTFLVILKLANIGMLLSFNRSFNPVVDLFLVEAGYGLLKGSIGAVGALLAIIGAVLSIITLVFLLNWALQRWAKLSVPSSLRYGAAAIVLLFAAAVGIEISNSGNTVPGSAASSWTVKSYAERTIVGARELEEYKAAAAIDPYGQDKALKLFDLLGGRDVQVVFIESYGRSSFDSPLYAPTHVETLKKAEHKISQSGLAMRSGWLTSPISGGQSWLAHGSFSSGLKTSDQARYGAMLASGRKSLFQLAQQSGYNTAAVMPAITLPWPEGKLMGFDRILAAKDMGYRGDPFNWVTMPDQYTLNEFPKRLEGLAKPTFIQIALISSHAPWTPVPSLIDWDTVGDGRIFNEMASSGDTPKVVWRDRDRVRDQYRLAVDYSLQVVTSHVERTPKDGPLFIILGDHQPAGFVAQIDSRDVPIHIIGPPSVIERLNAWGWTPGLVPATDAPVWQMHDFRDRFIKTFSSLSSDGPTS